MVKNIYAFIKLVCWKGIGKRYQKHSAIGTVVKVE